MDTKREFYDPVESTKHSLAIHLSAVKNWVEFTPEPFRYEEGQFDSYYTEPKLALGTETISGADVLSLPSNILILGAPGSGKTTFLKKLIRDILYRDDEIVPIPILIRVRDIEDRESLWSKLNSLLGFVDNEESPDKMISFINKNKLFVFIDGLDEMRLSFREQFLSDLQRLFLEVKLGKVIATSRTYAVPNNFRALTMEILPFDRVQAQSLVRKFLPENSNDFFKKIEDSKYLDFATNPLILAMLAAVYRSLGAFPDRPSSLYSKVVSLSLMEWDRMKNVKRESQFESLHADRKHIFLMNLAYETAIVQGKLSFTPTDISTLLVLMGIESDDRQSDARKILDEITTSSGLISSDSIGSYGFTHLSIHEYLAAEHAVRLPYIPSILFENSPEIQAITIAISANEVEYLQILLERLVIDDSKVLRFERFVERLKIELIDFKRASVVDPLVGFIEASSLDKETKQRLLARL